MKNIFRLFAVALLPAFIFGCNTEDRDKYSRVMVVDSVPTGAEIVVDGFKLGKAPITVEIASTESGCFVRKTVVTAIPSVQGHNTQVKTFPGFRVGNEAESAIPEKVVFDTSKKPSDAAATVLEY